MKRMITVVAFIAAMLLVVSNVVLADSATKADSSSVQREQQIKGGIQALLSFVSKYEPSDTGMVPDSVSAPVHKTWADVMDRTLNMFSAAISEIVGTVEKAAPAVWRIVIRQQYAKAAGGLAIPLIFMLFIIFYYRFMKKRWTQRADKEVEEMINSSDEGWAWGWRVFWAKCVPLFSAVIAGGFLIDAIQKAVLYCFNPYYYAIRDILVLLLGKTYGM